MSTLFKGLLDEIKFWQAMMLESGVAVESPEYQKMEKAMKLAQMKLVDILEDGIVSVDDAPNTMMH